MAYDVFISYSRKDANIVDRIDKELKRYGIESFIDRSGIELGKDFGEIIAESIYECSIVLFVWSENSNQSEHTANEIALAVEFEKTVVSFKIGTFKPSPKLAYRLVRFNRIDAVTYNEVKIVELGAKIAQILDKKQTGSMAVDVGQNNASDCAVKAEPARAAVAEVSFEYEYTYQNGRQALLRYDLPVAFSDLLEPALYDYKDARFLMAQIVRYRTRIWQILDSEFDYVKEVADSGNSYAQFIMARFHALRDGNEAKEFEYAQMSAEQNDSYGMYDLAQCYVFGIGVNKNISKYLSLLKRSMADNNPLAILEMAKQNLFGWDIKRNPLYGIELLKRAVDLNLPEAFSYMGDIYWKGIEVEKDEKRAEEFYNKAVSLGYVEAYKDLGNMYMYEPISYTLKTDNQNAIKYFLKGAEYNEPNCLSALALCYYNGTAVDQDKRNALKWFRKSAAVGDRNAYYMIGYMYYYGEGVEVDNDTAWRWFESGAKMIDSNCQYMMGIMCLDGYAPNYEKNDCIAFLEASTYLGGPCGELSALKLYDIFRTDKLERYDELKSEGLACTWVQKDDTKAVEYLKRAADLGNAEALFKYGVLLTDIEQPFSDEICGRKYLEESLSKGECRAALRLAYLYMKGLGVSKDFEKAKHYGEIACDGVANPQPYFVFGKLLKTYADSLDDKDASREIMKQARTYLKRACDEEYAPAYEHYYSSLFDELDMDNLEKGETSVEILKYLEKALATEELTDTQLMLDMGVCCEVGIGRPVDIYKAVEWYKKAYWMKNIIAPFNIANIYYGLKDSDIQNIARALMWYEKAQKCGNNDANDKLKEARAEQREYVKSFEESPDMSSWDDYLSLLFYNGIETRNMSLALESLYEPCRATTDSLSMKKQMTDEYVECKYLPKSADSLFNTLTNMWSSISNLGLSTAPLQLSRENLFPYCRPETSMKIKENIALLWLEIKGRYKDKYKNVNLAMLNEILGLIENEPNEDLQNIVLSIVECCIYLDDIDMELYMLTTDQSDNRLHTLECADKFYNGTDVVVRSYAVAESLYSKVSDDPVAAERLESIKENVGA